MIKGETNKEANRFSGPETGMVIDDSGAHSIPYNAGTVSVALFDGLKLPDLLIPPIQMAEINLSGRRDGGLEVLMYDLTNSGLIATQDTLGKSDTVDLYILREASPETYEKVLSSLRYTNRAGRPTPGERALTLQITDATGTAESVFIGTIDIGLGGEAEAQDGFGYLAPEIMQFDMAPAAFGEALNFDEAKSDVASTAPTPIAVPPAIARPTAPTSRSAPKVSEGTTSSDHRIEIKRTIDAVSAEHPFRIRRSPPRVGPAIESPAEASKPADRVPSAKSPIPDKIPGVSITSQPPAFSATDPTIFRPSGYQEEADHAGDWTQRLRTHDLVATQAVEASKPTEKPVPEPVLEDELHFAPDEGYRVFRERGRAPRTATITQLHAYREEREAAAQPGASDEALPPNTLLLEDIFEPEAAISSDTDGMSWTSQGEALRAAINAVTSSGADGTTRNRAAEMHVSPYRRKTAA